MEHLRVFSFFFFNDTATTEIYTLSLHDALPICGPQQVAAEGDAEHADGERGEVRVPGEPHRPQVPDLTVPLGERHVVDRALFDERAGPHMLRPSVMKAHGVAARPRNR